MRQVRAGGARMRGATTIGALALLLVAGEATAADIRWQAPVSGSFSDASKWEGGVVPSSADRAIFDAVGAPYTVSFGPSRTLDSVVASSPDVTLLVQGSGANSHVTLTVTSGISVAGELRLESATSTYRSGLTAGGAGLEVLAGGRLVIAPGTGGDRVIRGNIVNDGTVSVLRTLSLTQGGAVYTNRGTWTVASGQTMAIATEAGQTFRQEAGSFDDVGFTHIDNGRFELLGGSATGFATLRSSALVIDHVATDMGAAEILLGNGSTLEGTIHAGQTVLVQGNSFTSNTTAAASGAINVAGALILRSATSTYFSRLNLGAHLLSIRPTGALRVEPGTGGDRVLTGSITNDGVVDIGHPLTLSQANATYLNRGLWRLASGVTLAITAGTGQRFQQVAGSLQVDGSFYLDSGVFELLGGDIPGTTYPTFRGTAVSIGPAAVGTARLLLGNGSTLQGVVHQAHSVLVQGNGFTGHTTVTASGPVTVEGALTLRSGTSTYASRLDMGAHPMRISSTGTLSVEPGTGGDRALWGSVENEGQVHISATTSFLQVGAVYVNRGSWIVDAGDTLAVTGGAGQTFRQEGGTFTTDGSFHLDSGRFELAGGQILGAAYPTFRSTAVVIEPSAVGEAKLLLGNGCTLAGTLARLHSVLVQGNGFTGHTTVTASGPVTVHGSLTLRSGTSTYNSRLDMGTHPLAVAATGRLLVEGGTGGDRIVWGTVQNGGRLQATYPVRFEGTVTNTSGGRVAGSSTITFAGGLVNQGIFAPGTESGHGVLTVPGSHPVPALEVRVGGTTAGSQYDRLALSGTASLSGLLQVALDPGYLPFEGETFTVLTAPSLSGQFDAVEGLDLGTGQVLLVSYTSNSVVLTAAKLPSFQGTASAPPVAGQPFDLTVEAHDEWDALDPGYLGTVFFTSSDALATLPGPYAFDATDSGVHLFTGLVLRESGTQSILLTDVDDPRRRGTVTLLVQPAGFSAADSSVSVSPATLEADGGSTALVTVTPRDVYGNRIGPGHAVVLSTTAGTLVGAMADNGDGSYTQRLQAPMTPGTATVSATVDGVVVVQQATLELVPDVTSPRKVTASLVSVDGQSVTVSWTASSSPDVAGYRVLAELADGTALSTIEAGAALSAAVSGLPACTPVRIAVRPYDHTRNVGLRSNLVATTTFEDGPPAAPPSLQADGRDAYVALTFAPSSSCDVASHRVLRGALPTGPWDIEVATVTDALQVFDTVVANGTSYSYIVVAVDAQGNQGAPSPEATATPVDLPAADPVLGLVAAGTTGGVVELTWLPPAGDVLRYRVYRSSAPILDLATAAIVAEPLEPVLDDLPSTDGTYHYAVTWLDPGDNESAPTPSVSAVSDRSAPRGTLTIDGPAPVGISTRALSLVLDELPASPPALRFTPPGEPPAGVTLTQDPGDGLRFTGSVTIVEGTPEGTGTFSLVAEDAVGNSDASLLGAFVDVDGVRPTAAVTTQPGPPLRGGDVAVTLTASEALPSAPTLSFTPPAGSPTLVALDGTGASFTGQLTIPAGTPDGEGAFSVALVDGAGNTGDVITAGGTLTLDATPPGAPVGLTASVSSGGQIALLWQPGPGGASSYRVYRSASAIVDVTGLTPIAAPTTASYVDLPPEDGVWHWVVTAVDEAGNEGLPSEDVSATSDQTPPEAPVGLVATASDQGVALSWSPPTSGEAPASYSLYRSSTSFGGDISSSTPLLPGVVDTSALDRPPAEGTYFYVVAAVDAVGLTGAASDEVEVAYDATAPRILVTGVADGQHARVPLAPAVSFEDANLDATTTTLDAQPFTSGTTVSAEGAHELFAQASDLLGHQAEATVRFTLDFTPPALEILGVADGQLYQAPPSPVVNATDDNLLAVTTTLNGAPFASGAAIQRDGSYTLAATARDRAGNTTSASVSFTVDLPPAVVPTLHADVNEDGVALSWTPSPSTDTQQYRVTRNGQVLCLSSGTTCAGGPLPVAPDNARFEVRPVDARGQLGPPRELTVPPLRVHLVSVGTALDDGRTVLTRGAFDQVLLQVANDDVVPYPVGPATLSLTNAEGQLQWEGENDLSVDAVPQAGAPLDLVVHAHTELSPTDNALRVRLELGGTPNTSVTWDQTWPVDMRFPPGPVIEAVHGALVRGTEATLSLKLTNHGSAPLQVVTAGPGGSPSPDLLLGLSDPSPGGFDLEAAVTDTAAGSVQSDGRRVATLAPGASQTFAPVRLVIPADAPDLTQLRLEARRIHTGYDTAVHLDEAGYFVYDGAPQGFFDDGAVNVAPPPYLATATTDKTEYRQGELVLISGVATWSDSGEPASNEIVKLVVTQGGFDQTFYTRTDVDGLYTHPFYPGLNTAGVFRVSATHPIVVAREDDASFIVHGLRLDPGVFELSLSKNATYPVGLTLRNTGETPATGVTVEVIDADATDGVTASLRATPLATLGARQAFNLIVDVAAEPTAADAASFEVVVTTAEGMERRTTIDVELFGATPSPWITPRFLDVSVLAGSASTRTLTVENRGYGAWENVRVVPPASPSFLSVPSGLGGGTLAPGESFQLDVLLSPQANEPTAVYNTTLVLESDNFQDVPINMTVSVTTDATGAVSANVYNVVYALDPSHPSYPVEGASVRLQSQELYTLTFQGLTDATGQLHLENVPAGRYTYVVSKSGFQTAESATNSAETGTLIVEPSLTTPLEVGLVESLVDIDWTVTPTTVTDSYDVTVTTTYETQVPVPVIDVLPVNQKFDMAPGSVRNGQLELVNLGVVSAYDVQLTLRQDHYLDVQLAFDRIAEIPAQSRVIVPFTVHLKSHGSPPPPPCTELDASIDVTFSWFCVTAGVFLPGASMSANLDVKSHEADVRVEPNNIVRTTYYNCPGFENGEGVTPPGVNLSNQEGSPVEVCDCGRMTTAGIGLPTLDSLLEELQNKLLSELDKLGNVVKERAGLPDPPDLDGLIDSAVDQAGEQAFGTQDWGKIKDAGQRMGDAYDSAQAAEQAVNDALAYLQQNTCETQTMGQNISSLVAAVGQDVADKVINEVLQKYTGGLISFNKVHTKFDQTCLAPGDGSTADIPDQSSSFGFGTMSFSVASGCGAERGSCCPVSIGYVDYTVICTDTGVSTSQSGGGGGGGSSFGGWSGGSGGGGYSGTQEGMCER